MDNGLWDIPVQPPTSPKLKQPAIIDDHQENKIIRQRQTKSALEKYLVGASFSPVPPTPTRVIRRNHFITWPSMTGNLISKNLSKTLATTKCHSDQEFQNLQSKKEKIDPNIFLDLQPPQEDNNVKTKDILCTIIKSDDLNFKSYSDQTGRFPVKSTNGD